MRSFSPGLGYFQSVYFQEGRRGDSFWPWVLVHYASVNEARFRRMVTRGRGLLRISPPCPFCGATVPSEAATAALLLLATAVSVLS